MLVPPQLALPLRLGTGGARRRVCLLLRTFARRDIHCLDLTSSAVPVGSAATELTEFLLRPLLEVIGFNLVLIAVRHLTQEVQA